MGLYKRPGTPFWWYTFKTQDGWRIQESTGVADRRQAENIYIKRRNDYTTAKVLNQQPRIQLRKFLDTYMNDYARVNKISYKSDEAAIMRLLEFFGDAYVHDVTPQRLEQYKAHRRQTVYAGRQISGSRINRELAVLKAAFNRGIQWGLIVDNPVRRVKFFSEKDRARTRFLSAEEKKRLLPLLSPEVAAVVICALKTGMRQGEILGLKWSEVNLDTNLITLRKTKAKTIRHIPIHPELQGILKGLPKLGEYVFCERDGGRYSRNGHLRSEFDNAVAASGLRDFHFHDLRHTFASELVMKGVDIKTIAELLGHSTTRMTERYSHLSPSHKALAINLLGSEKALGRPGGRRKASQSEFGRPRGKNVA